MTNFEIISNSEKETKEIAKFLATLLKRRDLITLEGDLGAGKTTFTKGIAEGLKIKRPVTSPTFTIMKQYEGTLPLYHIDAYRLEHSDEDIGFDEYIYGDGITVIEWASFIEEYLPEERLNITIKLLNEEKRKITFKPIGEHFQTIVEQLKETMSGH